MNKKILRPLLERYVSAWAVLLCDTAISTFSSIVILLIAQSLAKPFGARFDLAWIIAAMVLSGFMFILFKTYKAIIRYSTLHDVFKIVAALIGKDFFLGIVMLLFLGSKAMPGLYPLIAMLCADFMLSLIAMITVRGVTMVAFDILRKNFIKAGRKNRVLIYSQTNTDKGISMVTRLKNSVHYQPLGFLVYGKKLKGSRIAGLPVYYFETNENLEYLKSRYNIDSVLFAYERDARKEKNRLIRYCLNNGLKPLIAPPIDELNPDKPIVAGDIRKIRIEDLLSRPEIQISLNEIQDEFSGKCILVTGAAGSIGSELCRQLANLGIKRLIMFDNAETPLHNVRLEFSGKYPDLDMVPVIGDVRQKERLDYVFDAYHPDIVFHAAAYKHVPLMEENPCEAVLVNVVGSRQVADMCVKYDVEKMVMISTDKAVNPTNIMGCTKRVAEIYVQALGLAIEQGEISGRTRFVTTRFGNVLGSNGSVIPRFAEQIANGGPVTVTHPEIERFFMTIPEACRLVMEAATMTTGNQIFVFDMGKAVKIRNLAEQMIRLAGFEVRTDEDKDPDDGSIAIEYCGLRPGEKLYEEVLATEENTLPTSHERIRIAKIRNYKLIDAIAVVDTLYRFGQNVNIPDLVRLLKHAVPEFKSNNSPYEIYDKENKENSQTTER